MTRPFVDHIRIEDYRCVRKVDVALTRLHAFIGPNDSGKSTILRAVAEEWATRWVGDAAINKREGFWGDGAYPQPPAKRVLPDSVKMGRLTDATAPVRLLRLDPDALRHPASLIAENQELWFQDERGAGLPALYDALVSRDLASYVAIGTEFKRLFPHVTQLGLYNVDHQRKQLRVQLSEGAWVDPAHMSEGMLYWLALAVVERLAPPAILLIEEPENGLHPARITDVMRMLRRFSERMQILLATHSPLVINELEPDEVTVVTRTAERGTICTPMRQTKNFDERAEAYALGELWLSYADGDTEAELVGPDAAPPTAKAG
ncbi:MAG: ATP-binding protein [Kofleriaceae bacterium]|nr:ATP-binding protein [Kofleriaceae bacterium]